MNETQVDSPSGDLNALPIADNEYETHEFNEINEEQGESAESRSLSRVRKKTSFDDCFVESNTKVTSQHSKSASQKPKRKLLEGGKTSTPHGQQQRRKERERIPYGNISSLNQYLYPYLWSLLPVFQLDSKPNPISAAAKEQGEREEKFIRLSQDRQKIAQERSQKKPPPSSPGPQEVDDINTAARQGVQETTSLLLDWDCEQTNMIGYRCKVHWRVDGGFKW